MKKILDPSKTKAYYQSYLKKKQNKKLVKPSKTIAQQPKTIENTKNVDIKSVFIEHPKTSCKLPKAMKQEVSFGKNFSSPSYSEIKKSSNFFNEKI